MMSEKQDYQTSELRLANEYMNTGELSRKVDAVLDHRYQAPAEKKLNWFQRLTKLFGPSNA